MIRNHEFFFHKIVKLNTTHVFMSNGYIYKSRKHQNKKSIGRLLQSKRHSLRKPVVGHFGNPHQRNIISLE